MSTHSKAAAKFIADAERTAWHDKALYAVREKRDKMARTVPEWEDLRRMSSEIDRPDYRCIAIGGNRLLG